MNIFVLDQDPSSCSRFHCDKHVVKQILEYGQLLSTAHRLLDGVAYIDPTRQRKTIRYRLSGERDSLYAATHVNHPCNVWVRSSTSNYFWLLDLLINLLDEYTFRYGKVHATSRLIPLLFNAPDGIIDIGLTPQPICMPLHCKIADDPVASYRLYYELEKSYFARYTKREFPAWLKKFF